MSAGDEPFGPSGRPEDDDAYYAQLRREAREFLGGRGRSGGIRLYREIEAVVAKHLRQGKRLPDANAERRRLSKRAGHGPDGYSPQAGWDLLHDFVTLYLFRPNDPQIYVALQLGRDLGEFRHWLRELLRRFLGEYMRNAEATRMCDSMLKGLDRFFRQLGLVRCGRRPARYWSEAVRSPAEAAAIVGAIDVEVSLDLAMREIAACTTTLAADKPTRLVSGWGPGQRRRMAAILAKRLSADVPGVGHAVFVPEEPLKHRLIALIEMSFPELFTEPLFAPLERAEEPSSGEMRETGGVRHVEVTEAIGAADAALEMMERLTLHMEPARPGGTSGADVTRAVRLYFDGAHSTREAAEAWRAEPAEPRGDRPISAVSLAECMPEGIEAVPDGLRRERLQTLCAVFLRPRFTAEPRSHVTVNALRTRCWDLWGQTCEGLTPTAEALAFHWFVDLLYAEVGRDSPFASVDEAALALQDGAAARTAARFAFMALRRCAAKPGSADLLQVLLLAADGSTDDDTALLLGTDRTSVARLRLAGRELVEKVWRTSRLLPGQQALAEAHLLDALRREQDGRDA